MEIFFNNISRNEQLSSKSIESDLNTKEEALFHFAVNNNSDVLISTTKNEKADEEIKGFAFESASLSKEEIADYTEQIHNALKGSKNDKEEIKELLTNGNLNSFDILSIMQTYRDNYSPSLAEDILDNFPRKYKKDLVKILGNACADAAINGKDFESDIAYHFLKIDEKLIKYSDIKIKEAPEDSNIRVSTMMVGIRG